MGKTAIGWTDETWNCVRGCSRVSAGCMRCYAEQQAARIVRMGKGKPTAYDGLVKLVGGEPRWTGVVQLVPERLADPLRWRAPRRVFANSMSDLFHESLTNEQIAAVFGVMAAAHQHTFQVLTKRARRMREWFEWVDGQTSHGNGRGETQAELCRAAALTAREWRAPDGSMPPGPGRALLGYDTRWPLPNVWLGVSVENQDAADERIPELLATPASVRFLSCEPLLGPVDFVLRGSRIKEWDEDWKYDTLRGTEWARPSDDIEDGRSPKLDWIIDGCESGPAARPAQREWFASLEEQCRSAGVAYFHKQEMVDGKLVHDFPGRQEFPA